MADVASPAYPTYNGGNALTQNDPSKVLGLIGQLNQNELFRQQINSRKAIGKAYQGAIRPDGSIDTPALMRGIAETPDAAYGAPEAAAGVLSRTGTQIENTQKQLGLDTTHNQLLYNGLGTLADNPKASMTDVHNVAAGLARAGVPPWKISATLKTLPRDPSKLREALVQFKNLAIGSAGTAAPVSGSPDESGAPTSIPAGQFNYRAVGSGGVPTALPPGEGDVMAQSANRGAALQATGANTAQYHADLENLKKDSKILGQIGGPTVDTEQKFNTLFQRLGLKGLTMNKEELATAESFAKIAKQISLNQSQNFHGSDAGLHTVVGANPNLSMSQFGREGVIDMLQGNQDAIDTTRKVWLEARKKGTPAHYYDTFINDFSKQMDPRVFQFNRMSRENQQNFLHSLDPEDIGEFEQKYRTAIANKWVKPPKAAPNAKP